MNLFEVQERLKDFSKSQLVNEMQRPSGTAPQYLVLSELQRRGRMEKAFAAEQAKQGSQSTVAQDAVNAAGMPQGGLAQMAQAMAPRTDMNQNTGVAPVQGMAEGGEVRRMDVGGLADITPNLKAYGVDAFLADPRVREAALRSGMTPYEYLQRLNEDQLNYLRNTPVEDSYARLRDEALFDAAEFDAGRYDGPGGAYSVTERGGVPGRARLSEAGLTGVDPVATVSADDIMAMANADRRDDSADAFSVLGAGVAGPYTDFLERMAETPLFPERRGMQFGETPVGSIQRDATEEPMSETLQRILANSEAAIARDEGRVATPASTYDEVMSFDRNVYGSDDPYALPYDRGMRTDVSGPGFQTDVFIPPEEFARGLGTTDTGGAIPTDRAVLTGTGAVAEGSIPTYGGISMEDAAAGEFGGEVGRTMGDPYAERGPTYDELPDLFGLGPAFDAIQLPSGLTRGDLRNMDTGEPLTVPEGGIEELLPPRTTPAPTAPSEPSGTGGTGAGGAGGRSDADRMLEQDKWLALAQFGLGLMSSKAPTLGQAIGEAGTTALGGLRKAQQQAIENRQAEELLNIRRAAAASSGARRSSVTPGNLISLRNSIIEEIAGLGGLDGTLNAADLERRDQLAQSLAQIDSVLGIGGAAGASGPIRTPSFTE